MKHKICGPKHPVNSWCLYRKVERVRVLSSKLLRKGEYWISVQRKNGEIVSVASKYLRTIH